MTREERLFNQVGRLLQHDEDYGMDRAPPNKSHDVVMDDGGSSNQGSSDPSTTYTAATTSTTKT